MPRFAVYIALAGQEGGVTMPDLEIDAIAEQLFQREQQRSVVRTSSSGFAVGDGPQLVQFGTADEPTCCQFGPGDNRGIRVSFTVSFNPSPNGSPLSFVYVTPLDRDGVGTGFDVIFDYANERDWVPTADERARSQTGSVSHRFSVCVLCEYFTANHTARFTVVAFNASG